VCPAILDNLIADTPINSSSFMFTATRSRYDVVLPSRQDAHPPVPWRHTVGGADALQTRGRPPRYRVTPRVETGPARTPVGGGAVGYIYRVNRVRGAPRSGVPSVDGRLSSRAVLEQRGVGRQFKRPVFGST
jgi:hypothetical protein